MTSPRFKFLRSKRGLATVAALLLILFFFRPGVYRLRNRIAGSIGSALDRRVAIDNVHLRLLPRPGFDLEGLVIYDDPAFSAEPMIRAQEVSAAIRLRSLLRGQLEIATLSATEPSVNLVRNSEGRWNLASLLERNAKIPVAPTAKPAYERRPAFPYLEASNARINFKIGETKKSYALMDADVALWQESENSWSARIRAEPVRTDVNLTDTGLLQINATWQRAPSVRTTPVEITAQWQKGQLGQITKLLSGKDRGWWGGVNVAAKLSGTPEALQIESRIAIADFHRYDIVERENLRLETSCTGQYDAATGIFANLLCESPVGDGALRLRGTLAPFAQPRGYDLTIEARKIPLTSVVRLARQAKKQIPADLVASGLLNGEFHGANGLANGLLVSEKERTNLHDQLRQYQLRQWTGIGSATNVLLSSNSGKDDLAITAIPLSLAGTVNGSRVASALSRPGPLAEQEPAGPHLRIGPGAVAVNGSVPVSAGGWISTAGYRFFLRGDVALKELFSLENVFGLQVARPAAEGSAKVDLSVSGVWQRFVAPTTAGSAQLHNVRAEVRGLNTPIEIASAGVSVSADAVLMQKISARTGETHWSGSVTAPRHCGANASPGAGASPNSIPKCAFQFDLTADQLSTGDLVDWLTPHPAKRPWYRILSFDQAQGNSPLRAVQAHGNLHVARFELKRLAVSQLATQVDVNRGKVTLTGLRAKLLQGTHLGNWVIDLSGHDLSGHGSSSNDPAGQNGAPVDSSARVLYHGSGTLQGISLDQMGRLMNDPWIAGTADGNFEVNGSGNTFADVLARSNGKLQFVMRNGKLPHVEIPGSPAPLPVHHFAGELGLKNDMWELTAGRLESRDGIYQASGTASGSHGLNIMLTRGDDQSWTVTGTLAKTRVAPVDETEARRTQTDEKTVKP